VKTITSRDLSNAFASVRRQRQAVVADFSEKLERATSFLVQCKGDATLFATASKQVALWQTSSRCVACNADLSGWLATGQRHHCRWCGKVFCTQHCAFFVPVDVAGFERQTLRSCESCFVLSKKTRAKATTQQNAADLSEAVRFQSCFAAFCAVANECDTFVSRLEAERVENDFVVDVPPGMLPDSDSNSPVLEPIVSSAELERLDRERKLSKAKARANLKQSLQQKCDALIDALPPSWSAPMRDLVVLRIRQRCLNFAII
jgi:hypothetical protein